MTSPIDYLALLDTFGQHSVDDFHSVAESIAVGLDEVASEIRRHLVRIENARLDGSLHDKNGNVVAPILTLGDLLPDVGGVCDAILSDIRRGLGSLMLDRLAASGRDAHEAFRRGARNQG